MHFHEKNIIREYALKKDSLSTILELHFEVILKKLGMDKQDIVVGGVG